MTRAFQVPGETMIAVKGGAHMSGKGISEIIELGLAKDDIQVIPNFIYDEVIPTGFGGVAADLRWGLASVDIICTLIHYDVAVLDTLMDESMANGGIRYNDPNGPIFQGVGNAGVMAPTGRLLQGRKEMYASGNHFFSVNLISVGEAVVEGVYRFRKCHLANPPVIIPLGTDVQEVKVRFRALPYQDPYRSGFLSGLITAFSGVQLVPPAVTIRSGLPVTLRREVLGSGAVLWDRAVDASGLIGP